MSRSLWTVAAGALFVACGSASAAAQERLSEPAFLPPPVATAPTPGADGACVDEGPSYCIECWIIGPDASGTEFTISAPKVTVFENQPASVRDSSQIPRPGKTQHIEWLEEGTAIDVKVFRDDDGDRFLDAKVQLTGRTATAADQQKSLIQSLARTLSEWLSQPAPEEPVGIRLCTKAVRVVEPVKLGKKIAVPLNGEGNQRVELRVSEVAIPEPKCAPAAEPTLGLILGGVTPRIIVQEEEEERLGIEMP